MSLQLATFGLGISCVLIGVMPAHKAVPATTKQRARVAFTHSLPKLDGAHLAATVLEVNYGPGESSKPHHHSCAVIGYVTEGSVRAKIDGQESIVKTGEIFYEAPGALHQISENASKTEAAAFLAFFVCDHDAPLSTDTVKTGSRGAAR